MRAVSKNYFLSRKREEESGWKFPLSKTVKTLGKSGRGKMFTGQEFTPSESK